MVSCKIRIPYSQTTYLAFAPRLWLLPLASLLCWLFLRYSQWCVLSASSYKYCCLISKAFIIISTYLVDWGFSCLLACVLFLSHSPCCFQMTFRKRKGKCQLYMLPSSNQKSSWVLEFSSPLASEIQLPPTFPFPVCPILLIYRHKFFCLRHHVNAIAS